MVCLDIDTDGNPISYTHALEGEPRDGIKWMGSGVRFNTMEGELFFYPYSAMKGPVWVTQEAPDIDGSKPLLDGLSSTH